MHFSLVPIVAGLVGTLAYLIFMLVPRALGVRVDVVRAAGSFITKNRETAFGPGIVLSFLLGIIMAYVYYGLCAYIRGIPMNPLSGLFYGLVQGVVFMLYTVIVVLEHHPDKSYQRRGPMTGLMQLIGNGIFGVLVGWICGAWAPLH